MLPKVIMHNEISLDGSIINFKPNMELYYRLVRDFKADVHLVGSVTAKTGIENMVDEIPEEKESDFEPPVIDDDRKVVYWVIPDSKGILKGLLHVYRRSEYCEYLIILVSKSTPEEYIKYLEDRDYDYILVGDANVDYRKAFEILNERYGAEIITTDSGGVLNSILLEEGLIDEISIIISPTIIGKSSKNLFRSLDKKVDIKLKGYELEEDDYLQLVYSVLDNMDG